MIETCQHEGPWINGKCHICSLREEVADLQKRLEDTAAVWSVFIRLSKALKCLPSFIDIENTNEHIFEKVKSLMSTPEKAAGEEIERLAEGIVQEILGRLNSRGHVIRDGREAVAPVMMPDEMKGIILDALRGAGKGEDKNG